MTPPGRRSEPALEPAASRGGRKASDQSAIRAGAERRQKIRRLRWDGCLLKPLGPSSSSPTRPCCSRSTTRTAEACRIAHRAVRRARARARAHPHLPADPAGPVERAGRRPRRRAGRRHPADATAATPCRTRCWSTSPTRWTATAGCGIEKHPTHGLVLVTHRPPGARRGAASAKVKGLVGDRVDDDTVVVHPSERGHLKQVLLKLGWPAEDLAGYVDGEAHAIELDAGRLGAAPLPGAGRRVVLARRLRASSCCPAAPARRSSARPRWRRPRRPR